MKTRIKTALALTVVAIAAQAAAQVTFYEREGFQGDSFTTRRQIADFARFGFNDRASSVVIAGDGPERWQVCEDVRFGGACVVLRPGQYPTLRSMGLNNRISSLQAVAREELAVPVAGRIVFYEKMNLSGRSFATQGEVASFATTGFNDRISSIEVFGESWEVCRDNAFAGPCVILREGKYPSLTAMGLDNQISSVRMLARDGARYDSRGRMGAPAGVLYDPRRRDNEALFEANVTAVRAVVGTPEQRCWVDRDQVALEPSRTNLPGAIVGAVIGGILGHQVGNGRGRDLATVGGVVAGGAIGATVGRDGQPIQTQDVQRCTTVPSQARADLWDVSYNFRGQEHRVQMTSPPGATITVNRDGEPRV
jgi:uncharacterized protein YcfJ